MRTLFPLDPVLPEGFSYTPDFLSEEEETQLMGEIALIDLQTFVFQGFEAKRNFASFGYDYSFDKRTLTKGEPIPEGFRWMIEKAALHYDISPSSIAEVLVLQYPVGAVINWHRDAPPFDIIIGISLLSDCTFKLRPHEKEKQVRGSVISLPVARRSIYMMRGPARSEWQHSTAPVAQVRYSITLRTLRDS